MPLNDIRFNSTHPATSGQNQQAVNRGLGAKTKELARCRATTLILGTFWGLLSLCQSASAQYEIQAIEGSPFGIAKVTIPTGPEDESYWSLEGFHVHDASGRVFYPVFSSGVGGRLLNEVSGQNTLRRGRLDAWFLFTGDEPFEVIIETSQVHSVTIEPQPPRRPLFAQRMWRGWWREFSAAARMQQQRSMYPPVVETYLTSMLAHRLGLEPPLLTRLNESDPSELRATLELLLGTEQMRYGLMRETLTSPEAFQRELTIELPEEISWRPPATETIDSIDLEPMASHVPEECLYIRFGSWQNQVWLKRFAEREGADLARLISLRSFDNRAGDRLQEQMAVQDSKFIDLVGGNLIVDVAVIGTDLFLREGASMGVILQARNALLGPGINQQRSALQKKYADRGATLETLEIDGVKVSFLSTPDNQLRSFYVEDQRFHLMTNSESLVRRFLAAGRGEASLAQSGEFQLARQEFPLERGDSIFVYLSSPFFQNLLTPRYQIEMKRRLQSVTDIEALMMARAVGRAEGLDPEDLDQLIATGLLPEGFGRRPDGSGPVRAGEDWIDSLRGRRGYFLPVADVPVTRVSEAELQMYQQRADYFSRQWERLDPLVLALNRRSVDGSPTEILEFEARLQPFGEEKYGWLFSLLGPPMHEVVRSDNPEALTLQASVKGGLLFDTPPHRLFIRLDDDRPLPLQKPADLWTALDMVRNAPGYLGAWPKPGFLDLIPIGLGSAPDAAGFTRSLLGLWRWQGGGFSLLSFDQQRLAQAAEDLQIEVAEFPAHMHLQIGNLGTSELRPWLEQLTYWRARDATLGNVRLLNQVLRQLKIAPEETLERTQNLLDVELLCPLGGDYMVVTPDGLSPRIRSTIVNVDAPAGPELAPRQALDVLQGAEAWMLKTDDRFVIWGNLGILPRGAELEEIE